MFVRESRLRRPQVQAVSLDAEYDGNMARVSIAETDHGKRRQMQMLLDNHDLSRLLSIPSVNRPIHERLMQDFGVGDPVGPFTTVRSGEFRFPELIVATPILLTTRRNRQSSTRRMKPTTKRRTTTSYTTSNRRTTSRGKSQKKTATSKRHSLS